MCSPWTRELNTMHLFVAVLALVFAIGACAGGCPCADEPGAVFVRWGRTLCPGIAALVYEGVASASNHASGYGGGTHQILCLPRIPQYKTVESGVGSTRAFLSSLQYQDTNFAPFIGVDDWCEVPCAVCMASKRHTQLMIPATYECPTAWTLEYTGYLMSERNHRNHHRGDLVCVDEEPEYIPHTCGRITPSETYGGLLVPVEGRCSTENGGLPCGPYVDGNELTCAVCTF